MNENYVFIAALILAAIAVNAFFSLFKKGAPARASPSATPAAPETPEGGVNFAGRFWDWDTVCKNYMFMGGVGSGKTFSSNLLLKELMRAGCAMVFTCVKPDDFERISGLAAEVGHSSRVVEITPYTQSLNLLDALLFPDGSAANAAELLAKIGEVGSQCTKGGGDHAFWETQGTRALEAAITLVLEVVGKCSIPDVHSVVITSPESLAEVDKNPEWDEALDHDADGKPLRRRRCAELVVLGMRKGLHESSLNFRNAVAYLTQELASGGDRMRGGIIANVNNTIGRFTGQPWVKALSGDTSMNPAKVEEEGLIGILNYPAMVHFTPARMWQFAWTMETQRHCMRRPHKKGQKPMIIGRDEVGWNLNPGWDADVCLVSRSQGLCHIDLVQDVDSLLKRIGGSNAKPEAFSFLANHTAAKILFSSDDLETTKYFSELAGQTKQITLNGGGKPGEGFVARSLGATTPGWTEGWAPVFRPEELSRLPVGVALMHAGGKASLVDFRSKR